MFITFIYKIKNHPKVYYGKYCFQSISDDHEGLDREIKGGLVYGLNKYKREKNQMRIKPKHIKVGVLSFSHNKYIPTYSTEEEISCFDFYCDYNNNVYVNGVKV